MNDENNEQPKGLKFQYRDGKTGQIVSDEPKQKVEEKKEGEEDAITNTKSSSRRKG